MTNKPIIIIGNGGHASVLAEVLRTNNYDIKGYTAPTNESNQYGLKYLGTDEDILYFNPNSVELILGIGTVNVSTVRKRLFHYFRYKGYKFSKVIHQSAIIAPSVKLGEGVQIMAGVILQTNVTIADNTIINTGTLIDHDCKISKHVHIAPGCNLSGNVYVGDNSHIGTGSTVIQGVKIGESCLIGAGSVVIKDINNRKKAYGLPAKEVN